ncbi:hypothetical protein ACKVWC_000025 [Pyricularia oryzae]
MWNSEASYDESLAFPGSKLDGFHLYNYCVPNGAIQSDQVVGPIHERNAFSNKLMESAIKPEHIAEYSSHFRCKIS